MKCCYYTYARPLFAGSRNDSFLANKYNEINTKIELLSKWMHRFVVYVVIPAAVFPAAIATGINFLVYDLGDESYLLPNPAMYVKNHFALLIQTKDTKYSHVPLATHSIGEHRLATVVRFSLFGQQHLQPTLPWYRCCAFRSELFC